MKNLFFIIVLIFSSSVAFGQDIFSAARTNDTTYVKQYIQNQGVIDTANVRGFTPLILAIYNDSYEVAQLLIEGGSNVNAQDKSGNTALMGAVFKAYPRMVILLLGSKANVNQQNFNGASALVFAATFGQTEIAKSLLENGANKGIKDNTGKTALDHATFQENTAVIEVLK
ncbi:ankyrin repeat domain-containing protein [Sphingobacterium bovistauri]|uniref:Ankyrin repeat domain-containing protein n=1 Tax=Sphingobacterium bovistauri TaxID=2781959 RepID=A0ABS7Z8D7_9SPHI|nr:ankyrin repeat domain-containing protein [Sphingobacterium bovistauri]MCA5006465.1 ankyrin repeat domain-containing protein [Sphingobacterium bovistauri]